MCALISILSGLIEDKEETKDMANIVERIEQHVRKITEGLRSKSTQVKEVRYYCLIATQYARYSDLLRRFFRFISKRRSLYPN